VCTLGCLSRRTTSVATRTSKGPWATTARRSAALCQSSGITRGGWGSWGRLRWTLPRTSGSTCSTSVITAEHANAAASDSPSSPQPVMTKNASGSAADVSKWSCLSAAGGTARRWGARLGVWSRPPAQAVEVYSDGKKVANPRFGTGQRGTNPKHPGRTCTCEYGLQSCRGESASQNSRG
jgi:hypothetical protein